MLKRLFLTIGGLFLLIGIIGGIKALQISKMMGQPAYSPPTEPVTTAVAAQESWAPVITTVGSLTAIQGVTIAAQLDGNIESIAFTAGSEVKKGDLLVHQDTSVEEAELRSAEAAVALAKINRDRSRQLLSTQTISQAQLDTDEANYTQTVAQADNFRALIAKKTIRAPFTGRLGIRLVNVGQTLKAGDAIVSLQALDPIYADFSIPQQDLPKITVGLTIQVGGDSMLGGKTVEGKITAINPDVDPTTRNGRVEATLSNKDEALRPGMYVDVSVVLPEGRKLVAIPVSAVLYAPYGDSVFLIEDKKDEKTGQTVKVARQQFVRLGVARGDYVEVMGGVNVGDVIVSTGAFKLHNGTVVSVDNTLAPVLKTAPTPVDS